ncbi:MAG: sugar phosphate isomerase/epimerase family protein [Chloroflexota bacterium]|nr:sugar phosphate isomerase/epimerase family protein [Chloroflexota bacterium]
MDIRYSIILGFLGQLTDRFARYHEPRELAEKLQLAAQIEGVTGVEPVFPFDFRDIDYESFRQLLAKNSLAVSSINVNIKAEPKFHQGALTSVDHGIRAEAVQYLKTGMDWAVELGVNLVTVCPLSDGHDYPFEINYGDAWRWMLDCLGEAAAHRPDVRLAVEYKQSEPRSRVIIPNAGIVLFLCQQLGMDNVGLTLDTGHALYNAETPAQVIRLAADAGRLSLVHINDNYRNWDWDMMPGTVNYWDWLETLLVLDEVGYDGWLVSDVFPARTDPLETLSASYRSIQYAEQLLDAFGRDRLRGMTRRREVITIFDEFQRMFLGKGTL